MTNKYCILGNVNNPVTKQPNQPYSWFVRTFYDGLWHNGHKPLLIDYKSNNIERIRSMLMSHKPKIVFTHLTFHHFHKVDKVLQMFRDVNKSIGTKFVHTMGDAKTKDRYMKDLTGVMHLALVSTKGIVENCGPVWKIPTIYTPYSSITYDKMGRHLKDLDFGKPVFTGSAGSHKDRHKFILALQKIMQIKIIQTQAVNDLRDRTLDLSASSVILGLSTGYDIDGYIDVRPFQYLGAGACMIMRKNMGVDEFIPDDLYYSFDSYDDPYIVKQYWEKIQKTDIMPMKIKAFKYMQEFHSSKVRLAGIIKLCEEI